MNNCEKATGSDVKGLEIQNYRTVVYCATLDAVNPYLVDRNKKSYKI